MSDQCPRLRTDLVVSRQETPEGPYFVLKDPRARRFFRLREAEYTVARRLDGTQPLESVAEQIGAELGVEATAETLAPFVEQLRRGGLLEGSNGAAPGAPARRPLVQGNLLWLRFRAFDPDRLLDWLVGKVRFCFTPGLVVGSAALILWALGVVLFRRDEIGADLVRLWSFDNVLLAWLAIFFVTTLHEFAHGLTCKHFGGRVHELGFLLIYLQPAFYCNVSDAWLFPEKSKRLWVTAAGAYFELFLWALATLVWRVTDPATTLNYLALVVVVTSGIKTQFNLNPLIKLDGYYLLSDWLDVPNLRRRAFAYLRARVTSAFGQTVEWLKTTTPRERWIYLIYGLLAGTYSFWLFGFIAGWLFGFLVEQYQAWGFA